MSVSNRLFAVAVLACFAMSVTPAEAGAAQSPAALPLVYVLSTGGSRDPSELYVAFRGRMPSADALLKKRGFLDAA